MSFITDILKHFLHGNPHVEQVHFTEDGAYHINTYGEDGSKSAPGGAPIVKTLTRSEILSEAPAEEPAVAEPPAAEVKTETVTAEAPAEEPAAQTEQA